MIDLLLALGLAGGPLLFASNETTASPADDAVRSAWETPSPDIGAMNAKADADREAQWPAFEPVTAEGHAKEKAPYDDGYGTLFGPASGEVIRCRTQTDTTCRAIQVLDRGFPERPPIAEDDLAGRDEIVEGSGGSGPSGGGCRENVVHTPDQVETEVCSAGGFYSDLVCRKGWEDGPATILTRWRCTAGEDREESLGCRVSYSFTTTPVWTSSCFFGEESAEPVKSFRRITTATAHATWKALCRAPQYVVSETLCEDVLEVEKKTESCTPGSLSTASNSGGADLQGDPCPGGVTLTSEKTCIENEIPNFATIRLTLDGFPSVQLRGQSYRTVTHSSSSACTCRYKVDAVNCDDGTCIFDVSATVFHRSGSSNRETGQVTVRHVFHASVSSWEETWTSTCPDVTKATGSTAERRKGERP